MTTLNQRQFRSRAASAVPAKPARRPAMRSAVLKRGLDVAFSLVLLAPLVPFMLIVAGIIRLESPGPAIFRQTRIGRAGRPFVLYKFRSMYSDAEARQARLRGLSDREGLCFKVRDDPRVTRIGRILRRCSIDELPQVLNVLRGEMSLVGPRPALPDEVAAYPDHAFERLQVRPGITGLWQVSGRADIGFDQMIDMDLAYVRSHSLWMDLRLMGMTLRAVASGRGAY